MAQTLDCIGTAEKALGLDITEEQIAQMEAFKDDVNYEVAEERERIVRHDVMTMFTHLGNSVPRRNPSSIWAQPAAM